MTTENSQETWVVTPIARVSTARSQAIDDDWGAVESTITLDSSFAADALQGIGEFSHLEVIYVFHLVDPAGVHLGSRIPRGNPAWPSVGIFAQRAKDRPNRIGLATCELLGVEATVLRVRGLDAIDGTPVLDIKPYMAEFAPRGTTRQPQWSHELMASYY
jgi:tRNA-Thr(GGU) m(6)t(6)A37 methyltransferase TsaA